MRLAELDPEWVRWEDRVDNDGDVLPPGKVRTFVPTVATLAEAQGIEFDCPKCGPRAHRIQVAFHDRGVLDHQGSRNKEGKPTRWHVASGSTFDDLSLTPSIDCTPSDPNCWHGFITNGEAT